MLALLELRHQLLQQRQRLGRPLQLHVGVGEVEVDAVAVGELRIVFEDALETVDRARKPLLTVVEVADLVIRLAQAIARVAQPCLRFGHQAAVRITGDEVLELPQRRPRLGLIALSESHLAEVRHPEL